METKLVALLVVLLDSGQVDDGDSVWRGVGECGGGNDVAAM